MKIFLFVLGLLFSMNAFAELHKWTDVNGKVHYSDQALPSNVQAETLRVSPVTQDQGAGDAPAEKTYVEREAELKKARLAKQKVEQKAAQQQAIAQEEAANCSAARQNLRTLQDGGRLMEINANGERSFLTDEQRQQRIQKAQEVINGVCK